MPSIKDIIELMSASWPVALALLLASSGILLADHGALPYMASLPSWLPGAAFIAAICSASVLLVSIVRFLMAKISEPFARQRRLQWQAKHVAGLEDLSDPEKYILAWAVANRTQVFTAPYFNPSTKALVTRGYASVPPGSHATHETPFYIPDHIWMAIKDELKDEDLGQLVGIQPFDRWGGV